MLLDDAPMLGNVEDYRPLTFKIVNKNVLEPLWDKLIRNFHYLGFGKMIGQNIKYLVLAGDRPVAALSYNRASFRIGARDAYIGWSEEGRRQYLKFVVCNHRFLILPWVKIKNLASHVIARSLRILRTDWKEKFDCEPRLVETFIDSERYNGTCYLAANFKHIGETKGYGKFGKAFGYHGNIKKVFVYELDKGFIKTLAPHLQRTVQPASPEKIRRRVSAGMLTAVPDFSPDLLKSSGITAENVNLVSECFKQYLKFYDPCFDHIAQGRHFAMYLSGLMSDIERKSVEPIALHFGNADSVRMLQRFMKSSPWDDGLALEIFQRTQSKMLSDPDGIITIDGCDFPKKGYESVGVSRQHCGPMGKTDNCQAGVMAGYTSKFGYGLIQGRLYLPGKWFTEEYSDRWKKCGIPDNTRFMTKNEIAAGQLNSIIAGGMYQAKWICADSAFGHDTGFLDAIPEGYRYFAEVFANDRFFVRMPELADQIWCGRGRKPVRLKPSENPQKARIIIDKCRIPWREVTFGIGSKGPVTGHEKCIRVIDVRKGLPNKPVFLYARKLGDGSVKYAVSNAPKDTPVEKLRELALARWPIEQCFEECKSCLGMDHYEGRSWKGWHRHITLVLIAHLFLQIIRKSFTAESRQLSEHGRIVFKMLCPDKKITRAVILTVGQAQKFVQTIFSNDEFLIKRIFNSISYTFCSYAKSFVSNCKKFLDVFPHLKRKSVQHDNLPA
jgi:SRSO17 transposase